MAIEWGSWTSGYSNNFRVGLDLWVSGTTINVGRYIENQYTVSDTMSAVLTGSISRTDSFFFDSSSSVQRKIGTTLTRSGSRGTTYSFSFKVTGIYNGASPSVSANITVPALPPSRISPAATISSITASAATASWTAPSSNGASIDDYNIQYDSNSSFSSPQSKTTGGSRSYRMTGLASNDTFYVRIRAHNSAGWSDDWSTTRSFQTLPDPPLAPSAPSVNRNSDTSHSLSWTRNPTSERPYTSQVVQRQTWDGSWGEWTSIATVSATATSWTDTGTVANRAYRWRVVSRNSAGNGYSGPSVYAFTTPATPTSIKAVKTSTGNIRVDFTPGTLANDTEHEIQHSADGGSTWTALTTLGSAARTYTHVAPSTSVTHTYRVRTRVASVGASGNGLTSGFRQSNTVQLAAPPDTPVVLGPSGAQDATLPILLSWQHVPVDSSDQTKFQLQWRVAGDPTWAVQLATTSELQVFEVPPDTWANGLSVEWQVRTWGVHVDPSPWSATAVFATSTPPEATITTPADGAVWDAPIVAVEWQYFDVDGDPQSGWQMELLDDENQPQETRSGSGENITDSFTTLVPDGSSWSVRLRLADGDGMWSPWASSAFTVDYPEPTIPTITAMWAPEQGVVEVTVSNPDPLLGEPEVVYNDVFRSMDGQEWTLVASQLPPNASVSDYESPVIGPIWYRAIAYSALPSMSESEPFLLEIGREISSSGYLSGGPGYTTVARALYNLVVNDTGGRVRTQQQFAGRPDPVQFDGQGLSRQLSITFATLPEEDDPDASLADAWYLQRELRGPHLWRDPAGRKLYGTISDIDVSELPEGVHNVSFTITRTGRR